VAVLDAVTHINHLPTTQLMDATFQDQLKYSKAKPVFKKVDNYCGYYRPVALYEFF
jgi:hypothetical protein